MSKNNCSRPQAPKVRNWVAKALSNPESPFKARVEQDRTKWNRKIKHPKGVDLYDK
jgi:hypothetical protein|tara:strand:- start:262 stop:429 length:168 start_codon:yes stop_codon:yes gene_type:complete